MPIQACYSEIEGWIELHPKYMEGLKDLEGFSHIILLYHFHQIEKMQLLVHPYLDEDIHGIFATRAPVRPNPIGISIVELIEIKKTVLKIKGVDILNQTPLLDIKPFVPLFDHRKAQTGWLSKTGHQEKEIIYSDDRF
jgi:tRNA-Thr(GGU) m(6)t(6)A37 methyltransferase TsaA